MIGIETEYGIYVEGKGAQDLVDEAGYLVKLVPSPTVAGRWDYKQEHPRRDMRGFTVDHLSIDPNDAQFEQTGRPHSTDIEVRSDRVLPNGARLYNDHGHPEYATPECTSLREVIAHDRAGERWMQRLAERRMKQLGAESLVAMYKNNTDFHGASYGTHESYLMRREVPFDRVLEGLFPFFATRQLYAGAGKVGMENAGANPPALFQLSQRADFFTTLASVDTLYNRPIVNTRDEPHADARRFRRLHVICGDANFAEVATLLKMGTTLLVLRLIEQDLAPKSILLRDPVAAVKQVSQDQKLKWCVERQSGGTIGAVDVQRAYLAAAKEHFTGLSPDTDTVLIEWEQVLNTLETDPLSLSDTLDWAAKRALLEGFMDAEGISGWDDPYLQSLDLEYHNTDPAAGLYYALEQEEKIRRVVTEDEIVTALDTPPAGSPRAIARGLAVRKFPESVQKISWGGFTLEHGEQSAAIRMADIQEREPRALAAALEAAATPAAFITVLEGK